MSEDSDYYWPLTEKARRESDQAAALLGLDDGGYAIDRGLTDAIGTVGNRPLRNGSAAERIARMQRARAVLASNPPKEMTRQEINEEISAYRKLKRLATAS
jgi:hypothetical protein